MNVRLGSGSSAPAISIFVLLAAIFGLLIVVGSFGRWASVDLGFGSASVTGVETPKESSDDIFLLANDTIGLKEGVATILCAVVGLALVVGVGFPGPAKLALGLAASAFFALAAAIAITDWIAMLRFTDPVYGIGVEVGWGLYVAAIAATAATGLSMIGAVQSGQSLSMSPGGGRHPGSWHAQQGTPRIGVLEAGRRRPDFTTHPGKMVTIGRARNSDIQLQDRHVGHQQLVVAFEHGSWSVRDVGQTNHARVLRAGARPIVLDGHPAQPMPFGQLAIGEVVITLFPVDGWDLT